jgi:5-(carboxyamino)imidazole ribonucleotide synthase
VTAREPIDGDTPIHSVGIVGAGQLARMMCEAASALGIGVVVLAEAAGDPGALVAPAVVVGAPDDPTALRALAGLCSVLTFDHEQVDVDLLRSLEHEGAVVRPDPATLDMAVDKGEMRRRLAEAGIPVPAHRVIGKASATDALAAIADLASDHGWPLVVKAARGGYDGKGVWPVEDLADASRVARRASDAGTPLVVEEMVAIDAELAVVVARRADGSAVSWPAVETIQVDGLCREVRYPGTLGPDLARRAGEVARSVADVAEAVGVLAVELFVSGDRLLVNEVAARPHNSAHWTIEGATTSQFENHLRAVLDLPLGSTEPTAPCVATVNVLGGAEGADPVKRLVPALRVPGAHVHLYGKAPRPGRKLGHVTVCGDDSDDVRLRAWTAARALGTPVPSGVDLSGSGATARGGAA